MGRLFGDIASYLDGAALSRSEAYFILTIDELNEKQIPHGHVTRFAGGGMTRLAALNWYPKAVIPLAQGREIVVVGTYGDVATVTPQGVVENEIVIDGESPRTRGPLRDAVLIEGSIVSVGMDRQAYVRAPGGRWERMDSGLPRSDDNRQGLEAVCGMNKNAIYAVGWQGEIWHFDGARWRREDSPTHAVLTDVQMNTDGQVYACGRRGLIVRGRPGQWEAFAGNGTLDDLWTLAEFKGAIYASSFDGIYKLNADGELEPVDVGLDQVPTYHRLFTSPDLLWSVGPKDVLAFDGTAWRQFD